jgi:hypothetical protein
MSLLAAGCVVADPPDYGVPRQTPPFLDLNNADPSVFGLVKLESGGPGSVTVRVRSEDAGDPLVAQLFFNYATGTQRTAGTNLKIPASTFDDTSRSVTVTYFVPTDLKGCQQLSLAVQHFSTYGSSDTSDVAIATWTVAIDLDDSDLVSDCPSKTGGTP